MSKRSSVGFELRLLCIGCGLERSVETSCYRCEACGDLFEVHHDLQALKEFVGRELFDSRIKLAGIYRSGVWRFKELVHPLVEEGRVVTRPEGNTNLYSHPRVDAYVGREVLMKHEGENPTGSFKDRGMTVGVTEALRRNASKVACASTGNTASSLAAYAALAGLDCLVLIPKGGIAYGKLSQVLAYGARVIEVEGNFDRALQLLEELVRRGSLYVLNSINPFRIEGQKTIVLELLQQMNWEPPDWIFVPAGNLGNISAFGKALREAIELDLIEETPKLAAIQASGANPFARLWKGGLDSLVPLEEPQTIASAIRIGNPVNWKKALAAINSTKGLVDDVNDKEIMDAKAVVDAAGIGCEPSSAASIAGLKKLFEMGVVDKRDRVVCVLTGNLLKDPEVTIWYHLSQLGFEAGFANPPLEAKSTEELLSLL